ncbi:MAG: hypothetical protein JXA52_08920, partial [Planctomycetes bacterium]|nr:hypothetical protein [Planctomycetota bacterium]
MSTSKSYTLSKIVPNAKLLSIKNFGEILIGCPSEVIKPLLERGKLPEYCVLTLRTMRQGRNLLDVEFLFYMISFYKKEKKKPFHFICTREQKSRIIEVLKEALRGPDFLNLLISLLPEKLPGLLEGALKWRRSPRHDEQQNRRAIMKALLQRIHQLPGLNAAYRQGMREHLTTDQLVRSVSACCKPLEKFLPGWHTRLARAWVQAKLLTKECEYFKSGYDSTEKEIYKHVEFLIFDQEGVAILKEGRRTVRIHQAEACYFEIQSGRDIRLEVDMLENEPPLDRAPLLPQPFSPP